MFLLSHNVALMFNTASEYRPKIFMVTVNGPMKRVLTKTLNGLNCQKRLKVIQTKTICLHVFPKILNCAWTMEFKFHLSKVTSRCAN
jgi:hypothetical protein